MSESSPDKIYKIHTEEEMLFLGEKIGKILKSELPKVIELIGDIGVGKTTLTRGIAKGLGVQDSVTSPSFTISKQYAFNLSRDVKGTLVHYDFYRLSDPGIMQEDLLDKIALPNSVIIVEWGQTVADLLPSTLIKITITLNDDESRTVSTVISLDTCNSPRPNIDPSSTSISSNTSTFLDISNKSPQGDR